MQSTSNTKAFIHKEQYGGKKKMKHPMSAAAKKAGAMGKKAAAKAKKKPMAKGAKKMAKPKKQGY